MRELVYHKSGPTYDIPYSPMSLEERNAIQLYEPAEEVRLERFYQDEKNLCKEQSPLKWPGKWHHVLDENMLKPTETVGNYSIHNTWFEEISTLNSSLTKDEEDVLFKDAANGSKTAKDLIITAYLGMAYKIIKSQQKRYVRVELNEMIAQANLEICEQVDSIIGKIKGGDAIHHRMYTILRKPIMFSVRDIGIQRTISIPRQKLNDLWHMRGTVKDLFVELSRPASREEVMEKLGWKELRMNNTEFLAAGFKTVKDGDIIDDLYTYDPVIGGERSMNVEEVINHALNNVLKERDAEVVELMFGLNGESKRTQKGIAEDLGKTTVGINKSWKRSKAQLKDFFEEININKF